jgi:hypothetical protein
MRMWSVVALVTWMVAVMPVRSDPVNADSAIIQDFERRVAEYVQLRKNEEAKLPRLRATASQEKIAHHERHLATAIVNARSSAKQGDIFTPPVEKEFRRLIGLAMQSSGAARVRKSLQNEDHVAVKPQINHSYPWDAALPATPPTILLNLPAVPPDIEYRLLNRTLVLLDTKANLIIDFITNIDP